MKREDRNLPAESRLAVAAQVFNLVPAHLVPKLARETGVDEKARTYSPWSHVVTLGYSQIAHSLSLNDVCDALRLNSGPLSSIRGATPPSRNNLSHANRKRDAALGEQFFWAVHEHLGRQSPQFMGGRAGKRQARRFRRTVHVVDSTTIELIASCMDWAKHRRRKAAAKFHLLLDLQTFLPRFAIVDTARESDAKRAREVCAVIREGEIVIFDKAYVDFGHLADLGTRGVNWITRAKENLNARILKTLSVPAVSKIVTDELIGLESPRSQAAYPEVLRRVVAWVEIDGEKRLMTFLTNQLTWSPQSIADLYRKRSTIRVYSGRAGMW
jgi:hypothetical protein